MRRFNGLSSITTPFPNAVITLGNFDGVHAGHRTIVRRTVDLARQRDGTAIAYTFYPHPVKVLAPDACPPLIQTLDQRLDMLEQQGLDVCIVDSFTLQMAHQEPKEFFASVLMDLLGAKAIVVGYDFTFGVHRRGTPALLQHLGDEKDVNVDVVDAQFEDDLLISSTEIRRAVRAGEMEEAALLMGDPYALRGTVITGHGIGATLGAHTANIRSENELVPREGVYITRTRVLGKDGFLPSITSVGENPTFKHQEFSIETHVIDYEGDLVGSDLEVSFLQRQRGQIAFDSSETLREQIMRDIATARSWHDKHGL